MEKKYYFLGSVENGKVVKIIQVIFGILCLAVAIYWFNFYLKPVKTTGTMWITLVFLAGFGLYMIWAGLGKASRFIEINEKSITIKRTLLFPAVSSAADDIKKIDIFPFNLTFYLKSGKKMIVRLSSSYYETNASIKEGIISFAEENSIEVEFREEKI